MLRRTLIGLAALLILAVGFRPAQAQNTFKSGYYEIGAGLYTECCGFAGIPDGYELPTQSQRFVELLISPGGGPARLTFLGADLRTVFTSYPWVPDRTLAFSFDNGVVFSNYIQFGGGPPRPMPGLANWNYTVRHLEGVEGGLEINGVAVGTLVCCDIPNRFQHTNVVATLVPNPVVIDRVGRDGGSMLLHFTGQPPYDYTVEYSDSLTAPKWQALSTHRAKIEPIDVVVTNSFSAAQARYFRVRSEPCNCR